MNPAGVSYFDPILRPHTTDPPVHECEAGEFTALGHADLAPQAAWVFSPGRRLVWMGCGGTGRGED